MDVKERLLMYLAYKKLGQNAFERKVGISNGYISRSKGNIGTDILMRIINNSEDLNRDWLLYGEGEMLKTEKKNDIGEEKIQSQALDTDQIEMIRVMQANMTTLFNTVDRQNKTIDDLTDTISGLTATIAKQNETISNQQKQIAEMETKKERQSSGTVAHVTTHHVGEIQK